MPTEVDHRISPTLHAENVRHIDGYDDDTAPVLAPTMTAFDTAYLAIQSVYEARAVAEKNSAWTEAARLMHIDAFAGKKLEAVTRLFDSTRANLEKGITALEQQLSQPLASNAAASIAGEIRAYVRQMASEERHAFLEKAIADGDLTSVASVLGAPAYLSGLNGELSKVYTRHWNELQAPAASKRLKAMIGAKELIEMRAGLIFPELEKAVGGSTAKAKKVREANAAAEKVFTTKGSA